MNFWNISVELSLIVLLCGGCISAAAVDEEGRLMNDLLGKKYNELARPLEKAQDNVTVHFSLALNQIISLDDNTGQLESRVTLRMWWEDFRLAWDPEEYGGVKKMFLPAKKVWTPDVDLYNGVDHSVKRDIKLTVYHTGAVLWIPVASYQSTCTHEFRSDSWHCPMMFRSWTLNANELDLKPFQGETEIDINELMANPGWIVVSGEGARVYKTYACCTEEPVATMEYILNVRGNIGTLRLGKRRRRRSTTNYLNYLV